MYSDRHLYQHSTSKQWSPLNLLKLNDLLDASWSTGEEIYSQLSINNRKTLILQVHDDFTSMPSPGPSSEHLRFCVCTSQIWISPPKHPDASNCPSVLKAKQQTESPWPTEKFYEVQLANRLWMATRSCLWTFYFFVRTRDMKMILVHLETNGASNHRQTGVELHQSNEKPLPN